MKKYVAFILMLLVLAACGDDAAHNGHGAEPMAMADTKLTLEAKDFNFVPAMVETTVGKPVTIMINNRGTQSHDFTIQTIDLDGEAKSQGVDEAHMHMAEGSDVHVAMSAGNDGSVTFTPTKAGTYRFECTIPGHKEAGMVGQLVVR